MDIHLTNELPIQKKFPGKCVRQRRTSRIRKTSESPPGENILPCFAKKFSREETFRTRNHPVSSSSGPFSAGVTIGSQITFREAARAGKPREDASRQTSRKCGESSITRLLSSTRRRAVFRLFFLKFLSLLSYCGVRPGVRCAVSGPATTRNAPFLNPHAWACLYFRFPFLQLLLLGVRHSALSKNLDIIPSKNNHAGFFAEGKYAERINI